MENLLFHGVKEVVVHAIGHNSKVGRMSSSDTESKLQRCTGVPATAGNPEYLPRLCLTSRYRPTGGFHSVD
jgi:hypothetical protein